MGASSESVLSVLPKARLVDLGHIGVLLGMNASQCFPKLLEPTQCPKPEPICKKHYQTRADYVVGEQVGLTETYNRLKALETFNDQVIDALFVLNVTRAGTA